MYCICLNKETSELTIMTRIEREIMLNVLLDLKKPIDTIVIALKGTYAGAKAYIEEIKFVNNLIDKI